MSEVLERLQEQLHVQESNGCQFSYAMIDPIMARELLSTSEGNRPISNKCVAKYAKHMERGTWETDSPTQFIMFDENGVLINGHHTLRAVIKSDRTVKLYFMFNVKRSPHIDSGRMRSESDRFSIMYGDIEGRYNYRRAVAVCNVLSAFGVVDLTTDTERWEYINRNVRSFNLINSMPCSKIGSGLGTAPVYAAMFIAGFNGANSASLIHFWEVLQDGMARSQEDRPIVSLRDWLMTRAAHSRNSKAYRQSTLYTVSDVLCKWLRHETMARTIAVPETLNVWTAQ